MSILSAAVVLFFVMDPLGNVPIFISVLDTVERGRRRIVLTRELIISLVVLCGFLFLGQYFLDVLNLKQESISVAGGIVLFIIALRMIFPPDKGGVVGGEPGEEPLIVPLAIPLIAGPSTMATTLLLVRAEPDRIMTWLLALIMAWAASAAILSCSNLFLSILGRRGLKAVQRLMGMILVMLSIQMVLEGIKLFLSL
ncbi:MAG: YhgN family NAAT transporter [Planctomycetota bacterium]